MAWLFTQYGVLMPSLRPPGTVPVGDNRTIQVRARRAEHLDILREETMGDELGPTVELTDSDYEFRAYCTPEALGRAFYQIAVGISDVKFKPGVKEKYGDQDLYEVYNAVWWQVFKGLSDPARVEEYKRAVEAELAKEEAKKARKAVTKGELVGEWKNGVVRLPKSRPGRKRGGAVLPSKIEPDFELGPDEDPFGKVSIDHSECAHPRNSHASGLCRKAAIQAWWENHPEWGDREEVGGLESEEPELVQTASAE